MFLTTVIVLLFGFFGVFVHTQFDFSFVTCFCSLKYSAPLYLSHQGIRGSVGMRGPLGFTGERVKSISLAIHLSTEPINNANKGSLHRQGEPGSRGFPGPGGKPGPPVSTSHLSCQREQRAAAAGVPADGGNQLVLTGFVGGHCG